jgi:F0F1-type ATP synthase membrane subunit b/b'
VIYFITPEVMSNQKGFFFCFVYVFFLAEEIKKIIEEKEKEIKRKDEEIKKIEKEIGI